MVRRYRWRGDCRDQLFSDACAFVTAWAFVVFDVQLLGERLSGFHVPLFRWLGEFGAAFCSVRFLVLTGRHLSHLTPKNARIRSATTTRMATLPPNMVRLRRSCFQWSFRWPSNFCERPSLVSPVAGSMPPARISSTLDNFAVALRIWAARPFGLLMASSIRVTVS